MKAQRHFSNLVNVVKNILKLKTGFIRDRMKILVSSERLVKRSLSELVFWKLSSTKRARPLLPFIKNLLSSNIHFWINIYKRMFDIWRQNKENYLNLTAKYRYMTDFKKKRFFKNVQILYRYFTVFSTNSVLK